MERELKGIWIPADVLERGQVMIFAWVWQEYGVNMYAENPMQEDEQ